MAIPYVKSDSFSMELMKRGLIGVVDKDEFPTLFRVERWTLVHNAKVNQTHIGEEMYKETIILERDAMVTAHKEAIAQLMLGIMFGLRRDPTYIQPLSSDHYVLLQHQAGLNMF